jgi:hypothetical protein
MIDKHCPSIERNVACLGMYVLNKDEEAYNDQVKRLTMYVE